MNSATFMSCLYSNAHFNPPVILFSIVFLLFKSVNYYVFVHYFDINQIICSRVTRVHLLSVLQSSLYAVLNKIKKRSVEIRCDVVLRHIKLLNMAPGMCTQSLRGSNSTIKSCKVTTAKFKIAQAEVS